MIVVQFASYFRGQFLIGPGRISPGRAGLFQLFQLHGEQSLLHFVGRVVTAVQDLQHALKARGFASHRRLIAVPAQTRDIGVVQVRGRGSRLGCVRIPRQKPVGDRQGLFQQLPVLLREPGLRIHQSPARQVDQRQSEFQTVRVLFRQFVEQDRLIRRDAVDPVRGRALRLRFQQQDVLIKIIGILRLGRQKRAQKFERFVVFPERKSRGDRFAGVRVILDDLMRDLVGLDGLSLLTERGGKQVQCICIGPQDARSPERIFRQRIVAGPHGRRPDEQIHVRDFRLRQVALFGDVLIIRHQAGKKLAPACARRTVFDMGEDVGQGCVCGRGVFLGKFQCGVRADVADCHGGGKCGDRGQSQQTQRGDRRFAFRPQAEPPEHRSVCRRDRLVMEKPVQICHDFRHARITRRRIETDAAVDDCREIGLGTLQRWQRCGADAVDQLLRVLFLQDRRLRDEFVERHAK